MKTKIIIFLGVVALIVGGIGVWFTFRSAPSSSDDTQKQSQHSALPPITLNIPAKELKIAAGQQSLQLSIRADNYDSIARVEYLLDAKVVARSVQAPFEASIVLLKLKPGEHTIQAIAYGVAGDTIQSDTFTFTIRDEEITETNDKSREIVRQSVPQNDSAPGSVTSTQTNGSQRSSSHSGHKPDSKPSPHPNPSPNPGSDPDPDPTPDPEPQTLRTAGGWWSSLPTTFQVCSNELWNDGPSSPPEDAIVVPEGSNAGFNFTQDNKVFWFAPGVHTLDPAEYSAITPGNDSTYIGAPGAILDGVNENKYAFKGHATNVTIKYLEIRNFGRGNDNNNEGVINHDAGDGWTMQYLNAHHNDGAAVFLGSENTVRYNCLKDNGQYGFSMFKMPVEDDSAIKDIVIDHNEITGNNQDDWEAQIEGCGCSGAGKFWDVEGATVTNNYVHDNLSTGLWADTNDIDFLFDSNWIEHNEGEGIWYEISYNATISRNVIKRNAWTSGQSNTGSPGPAIYISESGGDSRLASQTSGSTDLQIKNNLIEDNFSGVSIYENANRFCNSNGNTSKGYCTPFITPRMIAEPHDFDYPNPISTSHPCYTQITTDPYTDDCRWHSKNVKVFNNEFRFDEDNVPCTGTYCGANALFATGSDNISWDPVDYNVANIQNDVMFNNGNEFFDNAYHGNWTFAKGYGETIYFDTWQAGPYLQDTGSSFDGALGPPPVSNALDTDTATLENGIGQWVSWYNAAAEQSNSDAHEGTHSLKITAEDGGNWGVNLDNYPGFPSGPGPKTVSFWAKQDIGSISSIKMVLRWRDASNAQIATQTIPLNLSSEWQQAVDTSIVAPAGTTSVHIEVTSSVGGAGNSILVDDIVVGDQM